jgi:hypothetical protein
MIEPGFKFTLAMRDLHITPTTEHNTVFNSNLNLLHHHDFERNWATPFHVVELISEDRIAVLNSKYKFLFTRLADDLKDASKPIAVLNGSLEGWPREYKGAPTDLTLNTHISHPDLAKEIRYRLGEKLKVVFIHHGDAKWEEHDWGWDIRFPDTGLRENIADAPYAEPIHVFRQAYTQLGISAFGPICSSEMRASSTDKLLLEDGPGRVG